MKPDVVSLQEAKLAQTDPDPRFHLYNIARRQDTPNGLPQVQLLPPPPPPGRMALPPCEQSEHGSEHRGNCKRIRLDMQTPWPSSTRLLVPRLQGAKALHGSRPTSTKLLAPGPGPGDTAAPPYQLQENGTAGAYSL